MGKVIMQNIKKGFIVRSLLGHDKNEIFVVITVDHNLVYLANGKNKSVDNPKKKNIKHVEYLNYSEELSQLLDSNKLNNSHIIRVLKNYR